MVKLCLPKYQHPLLCLLAHCQRWRMKVLHIFCSDFCNVSCGTQSSYIRFFLLSVCTCTIWKNLHAAISDSNREFDERSSSKNFWKRWQSCDWRKKANHCRREQTCFVQKLFSHHPYSKGKWLTWIFDCKRRRWNSWCWSSGETWTLRANEPSPADETMSSRPERNLPTNYFWPSRREVQVWCHQSSVTCRQFLLLLSTTAHCWNHAFPVFLLM